MNIRRAVGVLACVIALCVPSTASASAAGTPDEAFGQQGVTSFDLPGHEFPTAMAATADGGSALALISDSGLVIAKLDVRGAVDKGFGSGGFARPIAVRPARAAGLFPTRDGGVIGVAATRSRLMLFKLRADGSRVKGWGTASRLVATESDEAVMTRDGGIVVLARTGVSAGYFGYPATTGLVRFTPAGRVDRLFGVGGFVPLELAPVVPSPTYLAVDSNDRILVGANDWTLAVAAQTIRISRFTPRGRPDVTFGRAGATAFTLGGDWSGVTQITADHHDRVVLAGFVADGVVGSIRKALLRPEAPPLGFAPAIARLTSRGRLDASFGDGGIRVVPADERGRELHFSDAVAVDEADRVVFNSHLPRSLQTLLRLTAGGNIDTAFDQPNDIPIRSYIQLRVAGGRIIAAGYQTEGWPERYRTVIAAYRD